MKTERQLPEWVYKIWQSGHDEHPPLNIRKTDVARLERQISEHGEDTMKAAWYEYVNADPAPYVLNPVDVVVKRTSNKTGAQWLEQGEDESQITRFVLAAFLAMSAGYIAKARLAKQ